MRVHALIVFGGLLLAGCASGDKSCCTGCDDGFVSLFDGKSLDGWTANEKPGTFTVKDGMIVVKGPRSHLFYTGPVENHDFNDFHLKLQAMTMPGSNSGVYFHTTYQDEGWPRKGFEAQVNATHTDPKKTGSLYAVQNVMDTAPHKDNEWFDYEIIVRGKTVELKVNGESVTTWTQPQGYQPVAHMPEGFISSGTFALQGHDPQSVVYFKNIRVKPLR